MKCLLFVMAITVSVVALVGCLTTSELMGRDLLSMTDEELFVYQDELEGQIGYLERSALGYASRPSFGIGGGIVSGAMRGTNEGQVKALRSKLLDARMEERRRRDENGE